MDDLAKEHEVKKRQQAFEQRDARLREAMRSVRIALGHLDQQADPRTVEGMVLMHLLQAQTLSVGYT